MSIIITLVHSLQRIYTEFITNWSKMSSSSLLNIMYLSQGRTDFSNEWGKRRMRRWFPLGARVCVCVCVCVSMLLNWMHWLANHYLKERKKNNIHCLAERPSKTKQKQPLTHPLTLTVACRRKMKWKEPSLITLSLVYVSVHLCVPWSISPIFVCWSVLVVIFYFFIKAINNPFRSDS